jgi:histidinol-phosphate/aromatic aminotransferase/cobyric acid decarboxylase-like protein/adenosyl cobinamide kinase/adenosyl cobinamide phosphate guanylyltransferase
MSLTLVLGGTRSGKSAHAEQLALASGLSVRYVGTADHDDASMRSRIELHVARRPTDWETLFAGEELAETILERGLTLIDGLGVWIAGRSAEEVGDQIEALVAAAREHEVIVVAEQAGEGLLPLDRASRDWLDLLGESIQRLSEVAERVDYVVAGRAVPLPSPRQSSAQLPSPADLGLRHHGDRELRRGDADHAVNVLAGGPPPWLQEALAVPLHAVVSAYPDDGPAAAAVAGVHGRAPEEVVVTNGAAEALWLLGPAMRPRLAAVVHPGFTESEWALRAHGIPVVRVQRHPEHGFALDPREVPPEADLVIVGNPASPDGTLHAAASLLALRAPGRTVVIDEAFMGMVPGEPASLAQEPLEDVIVVRSLTKVLSVPGLRVGYALAPPHLAAALRAVRPPWSANALALVALQAAAEHQAELAELAERAAAEGADLQHRLRAVDGLRTWPSATNFALVEIGDGPAVAAALRTRGVAVRPAASFPGLGAGHIRLTARDSASNARLVTALEEVL